MAASKFRQFVLLLWKNWLLQKRKPVLTFFEIALPTFCALILLLVRMSVDLAVEVEPTTWESFSVDTFHKDLMQQGSMGDSVEDMLGKLNFTAMRDSQMGGPPRRPGGRGRPGYQGWSPGLLGPVSQWQLAYSPDHPSVTAVMEKMADRLKISLVGSKPNSTSSVGENQTLAFPSEAALLEYLALEDKELIHVLGGIVFDGIVFSPQNGSLPKHWKYKIRIRNEWLTELVFIRSRNFIGPRNNDTDGGDPGYYSRGFLTLQRALDQSIIELINSSANTDAVTVELQRFPYPGYTADVFTMVLKSQLPFLLILSFMLPVFSISRELVLEKERKLKESMKMMGLSNWLHWLAWFTQYLMLLLISVAIITVLIHIPIKGRRVLNYTDPTVTFAFLLIYCVSVIMFCFMVSVFFSKATTGCIVCGLLFFIIYLPVFFLQNQLDTMDVETKAVSCLSINMALFFGCVLIAEYETSTVGLQWHNLHLGVTVDSPFSMAHVMAMLVADFVLYGLVVWYVDAVFPGEYGIPKSFYFFLKPSYWCGSPAGCEKGLEELKVGGQTDFGPNAQMYEDPPSNQTAGIQIRKLKKVFRGAGVAKKVAVNEISLDMYEGQITALLGHNGAGKTTTMFMLTGFIPSDGGNAWINGQDIRQNIQGVRSSLGLCPQHDVLFDTLTVKEHLVFFAKLKGLTGHDVKAAVTETIQLLHLKDKTNEKSRGLSGGMKRKLSVGIALIGGSKVVILDEPTSGMDPEARRQTWDILQSQRAGRTMLLTTHFMDEADYLGDRIAIMADGEVQCCGSSLFLKRKYGVGYHMTLVKTPNCDVGEITRIVTKHVPSASLESNISAELAYVLPYESAPQFEALFTQLEQNKERLGITSFGASVTTMEEVFLKVGEKKDADLQKRLCDMTENMDDVSEITVPKSPTADDKSPPPENVRRDPLPVFSAFGQRKAGCGLYTQQFRAMLVKRIIYSLRNWKLSLAQILVPVLFAALACWATETNKAKKSENNPVPRPLDLSMFTDPVTPHLLMSKTSVGERLHSVFVSVAGNLSTPEEAKVSMETYLISKATENKDAYFRSYMTAGSINATTASNTHILGWFNNEAIHSPAVALSLVSNTLLQYFTSTQYSISAINHPLPKLNSTVTQEKLVQSSVTGMVVSMFLLLAYAFVIASFSIFLIKERIVKAKHCQFVSGVHVLTFWLSTFCWDLVNYIIPSMLVIAVFFGFQVEGYTEDVNAAYALLILLLYGWAMLPLTYLLSFLFSTPASGCSWLSIANFIFGMIATLTVGILKMEILDLVEVGRLLEWVFLSMLPNYCFYTSLMKLSSNHDSIKACDSLNETVDMDFYCENLAFRNEDHPCCPDNCGAWCLILERNYFAWDDPGIGRQLVFMLLQGLVFFLLLLFVESGSARRVLQTAISGSRTIADRPRADPSNRRILPQQSLVMVDPDVAREDHRIMETPLDELKRTEPVILRELLKYYGPFLAVNKLCLGIRQGECFGLLGVNGAGKTTTFKMLTGDETMSGGHAYIGGSSVTSNIKQVQRLVGYCPQFDALIDQMTVRETLRMFARLRGVAEADVKTTVERLVAGLLLAEHIDKQAGTLSGGNKRKLSTAIALVGEPPVVFLDEPTTGMDPVARRLLWDTLTRVRNSGRTLILTSHSMEECEALCTRVAIMVNGEFKCLGSIQHLKHTFGKGYTLMAKVSGLTGEDVEIHTKQLVLFVEETFPGALLTDLHQGLVHFQIPSQEVTWAQLFGTMERAKVQLHIEDYNVSQTTLEQVFINFARAQRPPHEEGIGCCGKLTNCFCFFCCCGCRCKAK